MVERSSKNEAIVNFGMDGSRRFANDRSVVSMVDAVDDRDAGVVMKVGIVLWYVEKIGEWNSLRWRNGRWRGCGGGGKILNGVCCARDVAVV